MNFLQIKLLAVLFITIASGTSGYLLDNVFDHSRAHARTLRHESVPVGGPAVAGLALSTLLIQRRRRRL